MRILKDSLAPVLDLVFPPRCPVCGAGIGEQSGLCQDCWSELIIPSQPSCRTCQRPFRADGPGGEAVCAPCLAEPPFHDGIAAGTLYNDTSRRLILAYKHGGKIALAPFLARLIAARLPPAEQDRVIVPVPLHRWRLWKRGYNQAGQLARELARRGHGTLIVDGLSRHKATPSLGGLGAKARRRMLSGAIALSGHAKSRIAGREVILVDDVLTSGATMEACTKALRKAGASKVILACFARVLDEAI